jgi:uncharacterized membrane protein YcaP (DUF421 family)
MDAVLRGAVIFIFLLVLFRLTGKRTLNAVTPFDLVLLLIISEAAQNGMIGQDYSLTNSFLVILTLVGLDVMLSFVKQRSHKAEKVLDGAPLLIVERGRLLEDRMHKSRVDQEDVMAAARLHQGLERLEQIKYAVLEVNGEISIIPEEKAA